jgi:hypothetical protein
MTSPAVRIGPDEMWTLLDHMDLVGALRDGLRETGAPPGKLSMLDSGLLAFRAEEAGRSGEFPAEDLRALCRAGLAALAARLLLASGVITASVVGPRRPVQWHIGVLGRYVPNVSHVAVFTADRTRPGAVDARLLDQLDLAGIGLSITTSVADAVLGATLVVSLGQESGQIGYEQLARGSLMVNADGQAVTDDLRDNVARCYSLDDLAGVILGYQPGHPHSDQIQLVDLLEPDWIHELETSLAYHLVGTALRLGIGILDQDGVNS